MQILNKDISMVNKYVRNKSYQINSPLLHVGTYINKLKDINGELLERKASVVIKNIDNKDIIAVQGKIINFNPFSEEIGETPFIHMEIDDFKPGSLFGENCFFEVHKNAVDFKVKIERITFIGLETVEIENQNFKLIIN